MIRYDMTYFGEIQAHSLAERTHDIDLLSLDAQSVSEVR